MHVLGRLFKIFVVSDSFADGFCLSRMCFIFQDSLGTLPTTLALAVALFALEIATTVNARLRTRARARVATHWTRHGPRAWRSAKTDAFTESAKLLASAVASMTGREFLVTSALQNSATLVTQTNLIRKHLLLTFCALRCVMVNELIIYLKFLHSIATDSNHFEYL